VKIIGAEQTDKYGESEQEFMHYLARTGRTRPVDRYYL
jgi:hypothetical protein